MDEKFEVVAEMANTMLYQQDAQSIDMKHARLTTVEFELSETQSLEYLYTLNRDGVITLQRVSPYPLYFGQPANDDELVFRIVEDVSLFKNAAKSSNFDKFISLSSRMSYLNQHIERLFLENNVPSKYLDLIDEKLSDLFDTIEKAQDDSDNI